MKYVHGSIMKQEHRESCVFVGLSLLALQGCVALVKWVDPFENFQV